MSHSTLLAAGALTLATVTLAACQTSSPPVPPVPPTAPGMCRPDAADALKGQNRVTDAEARQITGASVVRQVPPGQGVKMDFRRDRVTIVTDPKSGRIVQATCG